MTESEPKTSHPTPPQPSGLLERNPLLPQHDLTLETFEVTKTSGAWKQWLKGWPLLGLLVLLLCGYGYVRGKQDYQRLKNWRGRRLATEALQVEATGQIAEGRALLNKSVLLAPRDAVVLRSLVDFCERQGDPMSLFALRQLTLTGQATTDDWERLCHLCKETGHPEMMPVGLLSLWAAASEDALTPGQLVLSCEWLTSRGRTREAEHRLLKGKELHPQNKQIALGIVANLAATNDEGAFTAKLDTIITGVCTLATDSDLPVKQREETLRAVAAKALGLRAPTESIRSLQAAFIALSKEIGEPRNLRTTLAAMTLKAANPSETKATVAEVSQLGATFSLADRLPALQWLVENAEYDAAIALCDSTKDAMTDKQWFTAKLDAIFAKKEFTKVEQHLLAEQQPLTAVKKQFFLYRAKLAQEATMATQLEFRAKIQEVAKNAEASDVFEVARVSERIGDKSLALPLYRQVTDDERVGLEARLGVVRTLDADAERVQELIRALEAVLTAWPQLEDARNDLIYLRLLEKQPLTADLDLIAQMAAKSPWLLAYQVTAALAALHQEKPQEALRLVSQEPIPWDRAQKGWQAVYAAVLAANGRHEEAKVVLVRLTGEKLRPGEIALLKKYVTNEL